MQVLTHMTNVMNEKRIDQIIIFLQSLDIKSIRFSQMIEKKDLVMLMNFDEALTHSSHNKVINYEKLEFFGDAVLRLAASDFIDKMYSDLSVGNRSELRAQIVSDAWLTKIGKTIHIEKLIVKGPKALGDENSKNTIIGESTEALIGAIYKCFNSIKEVNLWLDQFWEKDAELFLKDPHKYNAKSALQEWCQSKGFDLPTYKILEVTKQNGDPKRFFCEIFINGSKEASSYGQSHKKAEKNAASVLVEKLISKNKS